MTSSLRALSLVAAFQQPAMSYCHPCLGDAHLTGIPRCCSSLLRCRSLHLCLDSVFRRRPRLRPALLLMLLLHVTRIAHAASPRPEWPAARAWWGNLARTPCSSSAPRACFGAGRRLSVGVWRCGCRCSFLPPAPAAFLALPLALGLKAGGATRRSDTDLAGSCVA